MIISIGILFRSRKAQSEDRRCTILGANVAKLVLRFGPRLRLAACCFGTSAMNPHHRLPGAFGVGSPILVNQTPSLMPSPLAKDLTPYSASWGLSFEILVSII